MELKMQRNAIKLIRQIVDYRNLTTPIIPYRPQKAEFNPQIPLAQPFPRSTPEAQGISSERILDFLSDLENDKSLDMHSLMILRNGHVIAECSFGSYRLDVWRATHSLCKSITGLAIGFLIDEGRLSLDDRVVKIFEGRGGPLTPITKKGITVGHLLSMTSGIAFNEAGSVTDEDWVDSILTSSLKYEPGREFYYNSMNSYLLSAIVRQITGKGLVEYLSPRLFEPLGITGIHWETCPKGIEKGGWGLYIRPEDAAKIGQLLLQGGRWNGKQLISESWVINSTTPKVTTPEDIGDFDYGYHIWTGRKQRSFLLNGMFGQNIIGFPVTGILIVSNGGNSELFQQSSYFAYLKKYFGMEYKPPAILPENKVAHKKLAKKIKELSLNSSQSPRLFSLSPSLPRQCSLLSGSSYAIDSENCKAGLFPLVLQALQNNYSSAINRISFSLDKGVFYVTIEEEDARHILPVGFSKPEYTTLDMHGEPYITGIHGYFSTDEDENLVLRVRISFIETSSSRFLKFVFSGDELMLKFSETPGRRFVRTYLDTLEKELASKRLLETILSIVDNDYLDYKIERAFEPVLNGKLEPKGS